MADFKVYTTDVKHTNRLIFTLDEWAKCHRTAKASIICKFLKEECMHYPSLTSIEAHIVDKVKVIPETKTTLLSTDNFTIIAEHKNNEVIISVSCVYKQRLRYKKLD